MGQEFETFSNKRPVFGSGLNSLNSFVALRLNFKIGEAYQRTAAVNGTHEPCYLKVFCPYDNFLTITPVRILWEHKCICMCLLCCLAIGGINAWNVSLVCSFNVTFLPLCNICADLFIIAATSFPYLNYFNVKFFLISFLFQCFLVCSWTTEYERLVPSLTVHIKMYDDIVRNTPFMRLL